KIPEGSTTSAIGSATTRRGTNAGDRGEGVSPRDDLLGSRARSRRQRSKFDRVRFRSRQKALIVRPDGFQASIKSRQVRTRSGLCLDMKEFSLPRKTPSLPDVGRRHFTGQLPGRVSPCAGDAAVCLSNEG